MGFFLFSFLTKTGTERNRGKLRRYGLELEVVCMWGMGVSEEEKGERQIQASLDPHMQQTPTPAPM